MPKKNHYNHLTLADRVHIEAGLACSMPLAQIARNIGYSASSVGREIMNNRIDAGRKFVFGGSRHICAHRLTCQKKNLCKGCRNRRCISCIKKDCATLCREYTQAVCKVSSHAPYCCNGCKQTRRCELHRFAYDAKIAQATAELRLSRERAGINITAEEFERIHDLVWPLICDKGQSISHIWATHAQEIGLTERTFYRYVEQGLGSMMKMQLPEARRYKVRKSHVKAPAANLVGHNYADFLALDNESQEAAVEIDCVIGKIVDTRCLLTMYVRPSKLLLVFVLERKCASEVARVFDYLEGVLGDYFYQLFETVVCDRGIEFLDFATIEKSNQREDKRLHLYFTDPMRPSQKPHVECAHRLVRRILPKGTSFQSLSNYDAATIACHINSYARKSLMGASSIDIAHTLYGRKVVKELGLKKVAPDKVTLKPSLITGKR